MILLKSIHDYTEYIKEHVSNVDDVWRVFYQIEKLDDETFLEINKNILYHDDSKFSSEEFEGYRQYFYTADREIKDKEAFLRAWNHHQKSNEHHWEYWVIYKKEGSVALEIPFIYLIEMLCDWTAMSVKFKNKPSEWFSKNEYAILLHDNTYNMVKDYLHNTFDKIYEEIIRKKD